MHWLVAVFQETTVVPYHLFLQYGLLTLLNDIHNAFLHITSTAIAVIQQHIIIQQHRPLNKHLQLSNSHEIR